jgi:hypothetical protein
MCLPVLIGTIGAMTSQKRDRGGFTAMRQRECGGGARGGRRGDTGNDLERNAMGGEVIHIFTETTKDTRIATFEPDDETTLTGFPHDHGVDLVLGHRVDAAALADRDNLRRHRNLIQKGIPREGVMDDDIRLLEQTQPPDGD